MKSTFFYGILQLGGINMAKIRTPKEKEIILKDYLGGTGIKEIERKYEVNNVQVYRWLEKYNKLGIEGLISQTGKHSSKSKYKGIHLRKPKNKIEELELEIMKKDIEVARLKKGYIVKGVGQEKEFVTTFNKNT